MTHVPCLRALRSVVAVTVLTLVLTGLAGCTMGPSPRLREIRSESMEPVAPAAPEDACAALACEP